MEGADAGSGQRYKTHKTRVTGGKAAKKEIASKIKRGIDVEPNRGNNYKAFIGRTSGSHKARMAFKSMEKKESQLRMPKADRTFSDVLREPPLLVAVVGPPGSGKTTLIRSMLRFYAQKSIRDPRGPITIVAGRYRRITFMECPNTTAAMCDMAKVADLIILIVDGSFGFEMDTFEFLTIAQTHGFPRVIGVISHLDKLPSNKHLKRTKRLMRHRFWHEVSAGAKMLCLAPLLHGLYRSSDVLKMHRLLITADMKVQAWRNTHSCVFFDRFEDLTNPDEVAKDPKQNRSIAFYGYVRGHPLKAHQLVHIPGLGDFPVAHISIQEDPCTPFEKGAANKASRMRHLSAKHKKMYAPYCDAAAMGYDENAVFLNEDPERETIQRSGEGLDKLRELQRALPIDAKLKHSRMNVFSPTSDGAEEEAGGDDDDDDGALDEATAQRAAKQGRRVVTFNKDGDVAVDFEKNHDDDDDSDSDSAWSQTAGAVKKSSFEDDFGHLSRLQPEEDDEDLQLPEGAAESELAPRPPHAVDTIRIHKPLGINWHDEPYRTALKKLFVTGAFKTTTAEDDDDGGEEAGADKKEADSDAESYGSRGYESVAGTDDDEDTAAAAPKRSGGEGGDGGPPPPKKRRSRLTGDDEPPALVKPKGKGDKKVKKTAAAEAEDLAVNEDAADEDVLATVQDGGELQDLLDHFLMRKLGVTDDAPLDLSEVNRLPDEDADDVDEGERGRERGRESRDRGPSGGALAGLSHEGTKASTTGGGGATSDDYMRKKMAKKESFDASYDAGGGKNNTTGHYFHLLEEEQEKKQKLNKALEFVGEDIDRRVALLGYFSGLYVRIVIEEVPVDFIKCFDPRTPLFAGGLNPGEEEKAIVHMRIKSHRWHSRILKAQDPMMVSIGWRRIQVQPLFATEDPNGRHRYLKYTPRHMHCLGAFYAPVVPPNTGFVVLPTHDNAVTAFRIPATGYTVSAGPSTAIVKKLKLTGHPDMIQKTTVFVKGMFTSDVEAAKFVGAKVKAVSGLRGIIKRAIKGKDGLVRCTFEDKLMKSDIVFLRAWKPVDPPRYCEMVRNLLVPGGRWQGMRPMAVLRKAFGVPLQPNPDSEYRDIPRRPDTVKSDDKRVLLSRNTRLALPFDMKEKYIPIQTSTDLQKRVHQAAVVAPEPQEQRKRALLHAFREKAAVMDEKRRAARAITRQKTERDKEKDEAEQERKLKKAKKETARKVEFRTQHKSRKGKAGGD